MTDTPLNIRRGDREVIDIAITGLTAEKLTGASATFTVKQRVDNVDWVLQKTTGAGVVIDAPGLKAQVVIDPADFAWTPRQQTCLFYDFQVEPADSSGPVTLDAGRLLVSPDLS